MKHQEAITRLQEQVDGDFGLVKQVERLNDRVDSLHTKLTFGIGFITAMQWLIPIVWPRIVQAFIGE